MRGERQPLPDGRGSDWGGSGSRGSACVEQSRDHEGAGNRRRSGQASIELALLYGAVILPLTFMVIFVSEMLWVWHSVTDFTRDGARYAATHCWMSDTGNVHVHDHARAAHDRYGPVSKRRRGASEQLFFAGPRHRATHPIHLRSAATAPPTACPMR